MKHKKQPRRCGSASAGGLDSREWKFDKENVADSELVGCCWWEYARESALIRNGVHVGRMFFKTTGQWPLPDAKEIGSVWGAHAGGVPNELCGFLSSAFTPGTTGCFPESWQSLPESERKARLHIKSEREAIREGLRLRAFECLERWPTAKPQAKEANGRQSEHSDYRPTASQSWVGAESFTGKIEWAMFSNDEIVAEFREWVDRSRPPTIPEPGDGSGHKVIDWRKKLRDLGVMRLLNKWTVGQLPYRCPEAAKYFSRWTDSQFSAARTRALNNFRKLLRFLPEGELPIHAGTAGGRARL